MEILLTGGARSGKSRKAEELAKKFNEKVLYIATAKAFDQGMKARIEKHRKDRPKEWDTLEQYRDFQEISQNQQFENAKVILLDCVTLMVTNIMLEEEDDYEHLSNQRILEIEDTIKEELFYLMKAAKENGKHLICVTNEVGMGLVPSYMMGNIFRDIAGRMNQYLAEKSDHVIFMVSGLPLYVKGDQI